MNKKIVYSKGEIGSVKIIDDFLPKPADLAFKEENVKVTISLSKNSINFFKNQAAIQHVPYQKMIKTLLDKYANNYQNRKKT